MDALPYCGRRTTGRLAILSGLISAAAFSPGCASSPARSMAKMWDDLPKVRWSMSRDAADEAQDDTEIAANSPDAADESASKPGSSLTSRFIFSNWSMDGKKDQADEADVGGEEVATAKQHSGPHDPFLDDELGRVHISSCDADAATDGDTASPKVASHRDRLKAALSDDSRRNREPEVSLADQDRLRVRIEALMVRATELFEQGELIPAQRTADLAQNLAEECGLEFSPDEERPVDLLARIDARLEAQAAANDDKLAKKSKAPAEDADFLADDSLDFDPYVDRRLLPKVKRKSIFDSSLVVLEAPSFEEAANEPAVSPTAYAAHADQSHATLAFTRAGKAATQPTDEVDEEAAPPEIAAQNDPETDAAPVKQGPSFGEIDIPLMDDIATAPAPRAASKKRMTGTVSLRDIDADDEDAEEPVDEIRAAEAIPRWLLLSCLSVFAGAFSVWLIRRHVQGSV